MISGVAEIQPSQGCEGKYSYLYIGPSIRVFSTTTPITDYIAHVGNSDVPYTYAVTDDYLYLLEAERKVAVTDLHSSSLTLGPDRNCNNIYHYYYGHCTGDESQKETWKSKFHKFPTVELVAREE